MTGFSAMVYHKDITKALRWALANCPSYCRGHQMSMDRPTHYEVFFTEESDAVLFGLRWS